MHRGYHFTTTGRLVSFLLLFCIAYSASAAETVRIAVSRTPLSTPWFVAQELDLFAKRGLKVEIVELVGGHKCLQAMLDGEVSLATTSDSPITVQSFKHDSFRILSTFVSSYNDVKLMARKSSGINTPADLHGKRIGVVKGTSSEYFLHRFLLFHNIDVDDIEFVHVPPQEMPPALAERKVDALSVWEPFGFKSREILGEDLIFFPPGQHYRETFNLVGDREFIKQQPASVVAVLAALQDAMTVIKTKPAQAKAIVKARLDLGNDFIDWIWPDFNFALGLDQNLLLLLENQARWRLEQQTLPGTPPNYLNFFHTEALKQVAPDAVTIIQ